MKYLNFNIKPGLSALVGSVLYLLLITFPVVPGGLFAVIALLVSVSAITSFLVFYLGEDRLDFSNIFLIPLAGVTALAIFITISIQTVSLPRITGIFVGPGVAGILLGYVLFRMYERFGFNLSVDVKNR